MSERQVVEFIFEDDDSGKKHVERVAAMQHVPRVGEDVFWSERSWAVAEVVHVLGDSLIRVTVR